MNEWWEQEPRTNDIETWDVKDVEAFHEVVMNHYPGFNADISKWDVAKGTRFEHMVRVARPRGGVASKQLARAASGAASLAHRRARTPAASQFDGATSFNADLSKWDVAQGTQFVNMVRTARPRGGVTS